MKNSLALVITEDDKKHIRNVYNSNKFVIEEQTTDELSDDNVVKFQKWMNDTMVNWYNGKPLPENLLGRKGPKTLEAWNTNKEAWKVSTSVNGGNPNGGNGTPASGDNTNSGGDIKTGWYYVDSNRQAQGPKTLDELNGLINRKTLVYNAKIGSKWFPAGDQSLNSQLGDILGPPDVPSEKESNADKLLNQKQSFEKVEYGPSVPTSKIVAAPAGPTGNPASNSQPTSSETKTEDGNAPSGN
jgi:hypothetical protein